MKPPKDPKSYPRWVQITWLIALLATPIVLWVLPADYFDDGESLCPSVVLFDAECFGCGSTRAVQHLHHAELADALYFHQLSPLIYLFLVVLWFKWTSGTALRLGVFGAERARRYEAKLAAAAQARFEKKRKKYEDNAG